MDNYAIEQAVRNAFAPKPEQSAVPQRLPRQKREPRMISPHLDAADPIGSYARLSLILEDHRAAGQPVPQEVADGIRLIEAQARTRLSPAQQRDAMAHVHHRRAQLLQERQAERTALAEREHQNAADQAARRLTKGISDRQPDGLDAEQFRQLQAEGKFTLKTGAPDHAGFQKALGKVAASFDMTPAKFKRMADDVFENPNRLDEIREKNADLAAAIDSAQDHLTTIQVWEHNNPGAALNETIEMGEWSKVEAEMRQEWVDQLPAAIETADDRVEYETAFDDGPSAETLDEWDDSLGADVARAMDQEDAREEQSA